MRPAGWGPRLVRVRNGWTSPDRLHRFVVERIWELLPTARQSGPESDRESDLREVPLVHVVILCGGGTLEHDISTASGAAVARAAAGRGHRVQVLDPASHRFEPAPQRGVFAALTTDPLLSEMLHADLVFPAVHGGWGGDGHLHALLEMAGVRFTGAGSAACAIAWNKPRTLAVLQAAGVPTPDWSVWRYGCEDPPDEVWRLLEDGPIVVKESLGTCQRTLRLIRTALELREACQLAHHGETLLAMPYLPGREFTVGVVGGNPLPVVEIRLYRPLLDYATKARSTPSAFECPAEIPQALARGLARRAVEAHDAVGLGERAYSRVDFRCDDAGQPLCLEVNACPDLRPQSVLGHAMRGAGRTYPDLIERIMDLAVAPATAFVRQPR
jgi:D-alanine-D-alanine ligase